MLEIIPVETSGTFQRVLSDKPDVENWSCKGGILVRTGAVIQEISRCAKVTVRLY